MEIESNVTLDAQRYFGEMTDQQKRDAYFLMVY